jgi:hypothetical protein
VNTILTAALFLSAVSPAAPRKADIKVDANAVAELIKLIDAKPVSEEMRLPDGKVVKMEGLQLTVEAKKHYVHLGNLRARYFDAQGNELCTKSARRAWLPVLPTLEPGDRARFFVPVLDPNVAVIRLCYEGEMPKPDQGRVRR